MKRKTKTCLITFFISFLTSLDSIAEEKTADLPYIKDVYQLTQAIDMREPEIDKCITSSDVMFCGLANNFINFYEDSIEHSGGINEIYKRTTWKTNFDENINKEKVLNFANKKGQVIGKIFVMKTILEIQLQQNDTK